MPSASRPAGNTPTAVTLLLAAAVLLLACGSAAAMGSKAPPEPDFSTTRRSEKGAYKATIVSLAEPIPLNQVHSWRLHLEDASGRPLEDAQIQVDGGMPQHGHGLPTEPRVTRNLGGGDYLVEGLKFQMPGWWVVRFGISSGGTTDEVTFNLRL